MLEMSRMGFVRYLLRRLAGPGREPRVVRRVEMRCPHTGETVTFDLLMGVTGRPAMVLRCSHRAEAPPACDQLCGRSAEAVMTTPRSLLLLPSGEGLPASRS